MAITKEFGSGSIQGRPITISATSSPGNTIHTADASAKDEIWIYAVNNNASTERDLSIEFGGSGADVVITLPPKKGLVKVIPGQPLSGSSVVRAFASAASDVKVFVFVNRIT